MAIKIYQRINNPRTGSELKRLAASKLQGFLAAAWESRLHLLRANPDSARTATIGPFEVRLCPWRAGRPQPPSNSDANIFEPHKPCIFDKRAVIENEGVAVFDVDGRLYQLLLNINPVARDHWLIAKDPETEPVMLNQIMHGPQDIYDLAELQVLFPIGASFLFNSNPGQNTESGASQNHFHVHVLHFGDAIRNASLQPLPQFNPIRTQGITVGEVDNWPASLRLFEGKNLRGLSNEVFHYAEVLSDNQQAHNIVFYRYPGGHERIVVIPRTLGKPVTPFKDLTPIDRIAGAHVGSFGSLTDSLAFERMLADPDQAQIVLAEQLRETSLPREALRVLDKAYLAARIPAYDFEDRMSQEGLSFVLERLPSGLINRLASIRLDVSQSNNPMLRAASAGEPTVTVFEAMEKLKITNHMLSLYHSLQLFRNARSLLAAGTLEKCLAGKGNPAFVGEEGLVPSIPQILRVSDIINQRLADPQIEAVFFVAVYLHDLGKFLSQSFHPERTRELIKQNKKIRETLAETFTPAQLELIEVLVRFHSVFADMLLKEPDVFLPFKACLNSSPEQRRQALINDLLLIMSTIDTDAYTPVISRLSNDRIIDLLAMHDQVSATIEAGKNTGDLTSNPSEILKDWGRSRFRSWVLGETDIKEGLANTSISTAERELMKVFPTDEEQERFYLLLGSPKHVGLIYDLRKELSTPETRAKLLIWFVSKIAEFGAIPYEFRIHRENGKWCGPEVQIMRSMLASDMFMMQLDSTLQIKQLTTGGVEIVIPIGERSI
ncbi:MAG: hypothetical protein WC890_07995 [Candidatus Margulisiibacteriota bacterium]